jgi:hypothetical protein
MALEKMLGPDAEVVHWGHHYTANVYIDILCDLEIDLPTPASECLTLFSWFDINFQQSLSFREDRKWLVVSSQFNIHSEYRLDLNVLERQSGDLLVLDKCDGENEDRFNYTRRCHGNHEYDYPHILQVCSS